jgi:hypothetical protein
MDPRHLDRYGLSAIAQMLTFPLHQVAERCPEVLDHLHADLIECAPVPAHLWREVIRYRPHVRHRELPTPQAVRDAPAHHLRWLRDRTADALVAMADLDNPRWTYPTIPAGHRTNTRCVAYGTAGVLHALRFAGCEVDPAVVTRLRDDSLRQLAETPPGLLFGSAGISWVLAELGELDAAEALLAAANRHAIIGRSATLGGGAAGVALAHLSVYCRTGEQRYLDEAGGLLERIPEGEELAGRLGADDASGLVHGRPGVALALYYLARLTGTSEPLERGVRLLRDELTHALPLPVDALGFRVSLADNRNMPYLATGSAGYVRVLSRYLTVRDDPELVDVMRRCLRACTIRRTVAGGLFFGQAGLALALGEVADLHDRPDLAASGLDAGRAMFKHAVPHATGIRWTGDRGGRLSAELWSGSAGMLLALHRLIAGTPDPLFTLDRHVGPPAPADPDKSPPAETLAGLHS